MSKGLKQEFDELFTFIDSPKCHLCNKTGKHRVRVLDRFLIYCSDCYSLEKDRIIDNEIEQSLLSKEETGDIIDYKELSIDL